MSIHSIANVVAGSAPIDQGYEWMTNDESKLIQIATDIVKALRMFGYKQTSYLDPNCVAFFRSPDDWIHIVTINGKVLKIVENSVQLTSQNVII